MRRVAFNSIQNGKHMNHATTAGSQELNGDLTQPVFYEISTDDLEPPLRTVEPGAVVAP